MSSKVAANDALQIREKSKKPSKRKAEEEEEEEDDDEDESSSNSEVERSSAQSAHDLRKQVQQEELTLRRLEERLARLKQHNAKRNRALFNNAKLLEDTVQNIKGLLSLSDLRVEHLRESTKPTHRVHTIIHKHLVEC